MGRSVSVLPLVTTADRDVLDPLDTANYVTATPVDSPAGGPSLDLEGRYPIMATIAITCPKCEKQIKAPAELAGKKIRCKECQHVFVVTAPAAQKPAKGAKTKEAAPAKAAATQEDEEDKKSYGVTDTSLMPLCPYCAKELESEDQVICLNCGYNRQTRERVQMKKTYETTGGDTFTWLLPGIICAVFALGMIGLIVVFWVVFPDIESDNKEEWWVFVVGKPGRILGSVLVATIGFFLGKFAVKRLILNPTAPEREKIK
jgi:DNA-directed RNA polymerase subunit RPC12/RpoP